MRRERVSSVCTHDPLPQGFSVPGPPALYTTGMRKESSGFSRLPAQSRSFIFEALSFELLLTRVWKNSYMTDINVNACMIIKNFVLEALVCWIDELIGCGDFAEYVMGGMNPADPLPA